MGSYYYLIAPAFADKSEGAWGLGGWAGGWLFGSGRKVSRDWVMSCCLSLRLATAKRFSWASPKHMIHMQCHNAWNSFVDVANTFLYHRARALNLES